MENKKCPYCRDILEEGTFRYGGGGYFLPQGKKIPMFYMESAMNKQDAIRIPPFYFPLSLNFKEFPVAYACRNCKFIMIPYE